MNACPISDIRTLDPKFIKPYCRHGRPRFANEIEFRSHYAEELITEVIPEGNANVAKTISAFVPQEWRFSKKGIVFLSRYDNWNISFSVPKAENIFLEWLKSKEWKTHLSDPSYIASKMLKLLGGKWGISIIANAKLIKLLNGIGENQSVKEKCLWSQISARIRWTYKWSVVVSTKSTFIIWESPCSIPGSFIGVNPMHEQNRIGKIHLLLPR